MAMRSMVLPACLWCAMAAAVSAQSEQPRSYKAPLAGVTMLQKGGPAENRIEVVVMGDGYKREQQNQFDDVAKSVPKTFAHDVALGEYASYFNFVRANVVSKEDGVDGFGRQYDTALNGHVLGDVKGRGWCVVDANLVRGILAQIEGNDGLAIVFVRQGSLGTGGSGIATIGGRDDLTVTHEWGHAFAGLGDEYVDEVHPGPGGRAPNVSDTDDRKRVPWQHWLAADAPMVGVYEGAAGRQRGSWRPAASDCLMEHGEQFCRVCREHVVLTIYRYVDPIDEEQPVANTVLMGTAAHRFEVKTLRPKRHALEVRWWVFADAEAPPGPKGPRRGNAPGTRDQRGPLTEIKRQPKARTQGFLVSPRELKPGRYQVICRVTDNTRGIDDERWPWVLKDDLDLLESERRWLVVVD